MDLDRPDRRRLPQLVRHHLLLRRHQARGSRSAPYVYAFASALLATVDGGATTTPGQITLDTSKPGTHTIEYFATDQNNLTGYATRTVNVQAASSTPVSTSIPATTASSTAAVATSTASTTSAQ